MDWTKPLDLADQISRHWAQGRILTAKFDGTSLFPLRLRLRRPDRKALGQRFVEVRAWIRELEDGSRAKRGFGYDIEWIDIKHRQLGRNQIPDGILVPTERDALRLIGKDREAQRFRERADSTLAIFPSLADWIKRKPLTVLENAADWDRILAVLVWFRDHPRSGLYLRQLDIPGVDTKFIEGRKGLLAELLDVVQPLQTGENKLIGTRFFEQRFGLRNKPPLVRFRLLDDQLTIHGLSDISVPAEQFAALSSPAQRIFITENEVNGLAFPNVASGLVIFGLGYGLDLLSGVNWIKDREIYYWGDIDTHGFAMLDRLRSKFPSASSFLMDRETLVAHRSLWSHEPIPHIGVLTRLRDAERTLFEDLQLNRIGEGVRLEQERISFSYLQQTVQEILCPNQKDRYYEVVVGGRAAPSSLA
jgi:hypothetical protein